MISLPLSFLVSLVLAAIILRLLMQPREEVRANRMFIALLAVYMLQTVLVGLRWGYGVTAILPLLTLVASIIPPLSYLTFRDLVAARPGLRLSDWPHALPPLILLLLLRFFRDPIDLLLMAEFFGYGFMLLFLTRHGPDGLIASRLDGSLRSYRSLQIAGYALIASALTDMAVSLDLAFGFGQAPLVVSLATTLTLLLLGFAATMAGSEGKGIEDEETATEAGSPVLLPEAEKRDITPDHTETARRLDQLMEEKAPWRDPDLNLARLARKLGMPARQVSEAVNRVHRLSVSQYVNNRRVGEACRLLDETDEPVTRIMFEAGFITKSNFNREFTRATGMSPSDWRRRQGLKRADG